MVLTSVQASGSIPKSPSSNRVDIDMLLMETNRIDFKTLSIPGVDVNKAQVFNGMLMGKLSQI